MASENVTALMKALEAGNQLASPDRLVGGAVFQIENLDDVMHVVTIDEKAIKLQKGMESKPCKSTLAQFDRYLSYGILGGSAQTEGAIGQEEDSIAARIVVPMAYYSHVRRVTDAANMVSTVDGVKAEDRAARDAAIKIAADLEFDLFRGKSDFSNAGVFDGNMGVIPSLPNVLGLDSQIRMSDTEPNSQDQMFAEYGTNESVIVSVGGTLTQDSIEDAHVKSVIHHGEAEDLFVDPRVASAYNKISFGKERIVLAGSPQDATAADLKRQWVSGGTVSLQTSIFLSGKTGPAKARPTGPAAPGLALGSDVVGSTSIAAGTYIYYVTSCNTIGESPVSAPLTVSGVAAGDQITLTITPSGTVQYFNVYRTNANGVAASAKFIGRVQNSGGGTTSFVDLGNKKPGFVTGFLVQKDSMSLFELSPYSRKKLAVTDLTNPEAFFRFVTLGVMKPRFNTLLDNLVGSF
jgi:hypothetical protein